MIPLSLLIVLPVVSSAVFLSVGPSLIVVGFGSSFQLLSRGFSFRHDGGGRRPLEEGEGTAGMTERASTPSSICLSDPQGRDKAVAQEEAQNSVKRVHFGTHRSRVSVHASHEALTLRSPWLTLAHPARKVRMFKEAWCG
jgi:hypothetical protein